MSQASNNNKAQNAIQEWMTARKINCQSIAIDLNIMYAQVWRWVYGKTVPNLKNAVAIQNMTKGKVKCEMWLEPITTKKVKSSK